MPHTTPQSFGQYYLDEKIAQGGMAEIYKSRLKDPQGFNKTVVIKKILPHIAANPEFIEMLVDEAKIAVLLSHGNIAQIHDLGKVGSDYFIVMEYVDGKSVSQMIRRSKTFGKNIPIDIACYIAAEVANGLDYMHRKMDEGGNPLFIIHRDISPQNIIISSSRTVKIIDFGIAKAKTKISTTDSGIVKGKFAYMSPEHTEGEKLDYRTDIFSLGIILFEMTTGQRLFKGTNNADTIRKVKRCKVPTPSAFREEIPHELDKIILKALKRNRDKRYLSAHGLQLDLTRLLVHHYPDFMPHNVAHFIKQLFSDSEIYAPPPETTPLQWQETIREAEKTQTRAPVKSLREEGDETLMADPHIMRKRLKELEAYHLPEPPLPPPAEGEVEISPKKKTLNIFSIFSFLKKIPWTKTMRPLAFIALITCLLGAIYYTYEKMDLWINPPEEEMLIEEGEDFLPDETISHKPPPQTQIEEKISPPPPKEPVITTGSVSITTEPPGAKVFVNDAEMNTLTPTTIQDLRTERFHKIGLFRDGYEFFEKEISVETGGTLRLHIPLKINYGALQINSIPPDASITLNGQVVGRTPFLLDKITPETIYQIQLQHEDFKDWGKTVKIFAGKKEVVNISLEKKPKKPRRP